MERGRIQGQGLPNFFWVLLLSQERVKLWNSNLAGTFTGPIQKPIKNCEKRQRGRIRGLPKFLSTLYYLRNG